MSLETNFIYIVASVESTTSQKKKKLILFGISCFPREIVWSIPTKDAPNSKSAHTWYFITRGAKCRKINVLHVLKNYHHLEARFQALFGTTFT
jgi:hypothetical protein